MADTSPCSIPAQITAGDTVTWQRSLADYPAGDGWTLAYTLVSSSKAYSFSAANDGDDYVISVDANTTAAWDAGSYRITEYVAKGSERYTLGNYTLQVLPDLAVATAGIDTRTHEEKVLASINGWLESKAPVYGSMEINGRKISYYPIADLLVLRDRYAREVARQQRIKCGGGPGHRILAVL